MDPQPQVVSERALANIVIAEVMPGGLRDRLSMMLSGGGVMPSSYLLEGKGCLMSYKRLTRTPKWVYMSQTFMSECKGAAYAIRSLLPSRVPFTLRKGRGVSAEA